MPAEEHVRLPDGRFLLESLPSSMLALGIAYQSLPAGESEADREHAALQASQSPSTAFVYASSLLIVAQNNLIALRRALTGPVLTLAPWGVARSEPDPVLRTVHV